MNTYPKNSKLLPWLMALALTGLVAGCGGSGGGGGNAPAGGPGAGAGDPGPAGASPVLGSAAPYGVMVHSAAIVMQVDSHVVGDVALDPANSCGGCGPGHNAVVSGTINNGDFENITLLPLPVGSAHQAFLDADLAYTDASTRSTNACVLAAAGDISAAQGVCPNGVTPGPVYGPGLYRSANPIGFTGTITLDAGGNPNAVFIFQTDAAITTQPNTTVVLAGGAQAKNVWWMAGSAATLGYSSTFKGTVIATADLTIGVGSTIGSPMQMEGRVFSRGAAATVGSFATVTVPQ